MRALVIGGAGFIGSNIVRKAIDRNLEVRVLDNMFTGSRSNLAALDVELVEGDVRNESVTDKATRDVDYVFHEAAASSSQMFVPNPKEGMDVNLTGFLNVLHSASKNGVRKVVYAVSSSLYGNAPVPWVEDNINLKDCPNAYAYSLLARSFFAKLYSDHQNLKSLGLIYFSVYGPYEKAKGNYANIISQFLWSMMKNDRPILYGDGNQTRDFIHVDDVAEANLLAAEANLTGEVLNIGTGVETSMRRVVDLLNQNLGTKSEPIYKPNPILGYCYRTLADTKKAERLLSFRAKVTLEEGLRSLLRFYGATTV